jgi:hypothetical protein
MFRAALILDCACQSERVHVGCLLVDQRDDLLCVTGRFQLQYLQRFGPAADRHVLRSPRRQVSGNDLATAGVSVMTIVQIPLKHDTAVGAIQRRTIAVPFVIRAVN